MSTFSASPSNFSDIAQILKNKSTAIRNEADLSSIRNAVDPDLTAADVVWSTLSRRQKHVLCKYFELKTVFDDEGQFISCVERTGCITNRQQHGPCDVVRDDSAKSGGLYILVHGRATVMVGEYSIVIHDDINECCCLGVVMGRLAVPKDAQIFFNNESLSTTHSIYRRFVSLEERRGNVSIRFEKGSTYLVLPETKSRTFIEKLNASLITRRVFNDIGIVKLLDRGRNCSFGGTTQNELTTCQHAPVNNNKESPRIFRFRAGHILMREGAFSSRVLFIAKGNCLVFRNDKVRELPSCVGSMCSPAFLGLLGLFEWFESDGDNVSNNIGRQPISAVAVTDGYAYSFCSTKFCRAVANSPTQSPESCNSRLMTAFEFLANSQRAAWCGENIAAEGVHSRDEASEKEGDTKQRGSPSQEDGGCPDKEGDSNIEEVTTAGTLPVSSTASFADQQTAIYAEELRSQRPTETIEQPKESSPEKLASIIDRLSNGKLNRSKFLASIHESFLTDAAKDTSEEEILNDRETLLLRSGKDNMLAEIMTALAIGRGVDTLKCESNDPFHNFSINSPSTDDSDLQMVLEIPFPMPNRLSCMANNCLGRKRLPEYNDSDPFLTPVPSVLHSRKMHGSTLPIVRRSKGCIDPLVYNEEEWI